MESHHCSGIQESGENLDSKMPLNLEMNIYSLSAAEDPQSYSGIFQGWQEILYICIRIP